MSKNSTLASLSMLKLKLDEGGNYLEYLQPFVMHILGRGANQTITSLNMSEVLRKEFGLRIPRQVIERILNRIADLGFLKKIKDSYILISEIKKDSFLEDYDKFISKNSRVTDEMITFAMKNFEEDINSNMAFDSLYKFLDRFSINCLDNHIKGTTLPIPTNIKNWQLFIACKFVNKISSENLDLFNDFIQFVEGHLMANALLCPDLESISKETYKKTTFFLDTPILLSLLRLHGKHEYESINELIKLLSKLSGKIACFSHTFSEVKNVILDAADNLDSSADKKKVVLEARNSKKNRSDLILFAELLEDKLIENNIIYIDTPKYDPSLQFNEAAFRDLLTENVPYRHENSKDKDIKSVSSIYVLRAGHNPTKIENSKAILVTNNAAFAETAFTHGKEFEGSKIVSTVITDSVLINIAWLKAPLVAENLPRKDVLAYCHSATKLNEKFWEKFLLEAKNMKDNNLITPKSLQLLRCHHDAPEFAMNATLGDRERVSKDSIIETLDRIYKDLEVDLTRQLDKSEAENIKIISRLESGNKYILELIDNSFDACVLGSKYIARLIGAILVIILFYWIPDSFSNPLTLSGFSIIGITKYMNKYFEGRCKRLKKANRSKLLNI
ncbi:MAG: hypothetical protein K0U66_06470 [Gammaproteobacteria bacterium]|nr:hypothetical protein [Gammaproteobacteria bacterium]